MQDTFGGVIFHLNKQEPSFLRGRRVALALLLAFGNLGFAQDTSPDTGTKPSITRAGVNPSTGQLVIQGTRLAPASGAPRVQLDGGTLTLVLHTATQIVRIFRAA
jgi:hypothetical protein